MIVFVKIDPTTGNGLGPNFIVSSNFGSVSPASATRNDLLDGVYFTVNDAATKITLTSQGSCTNSFEVNIINLPPTTTTTSTTTKSCQFTGGGSAIIVPTTTSSTTLAPTTTTSTTQGPPTTSTTTLPPTGKIAVRPLNLDGFIGIAANRISGTNPNSLTFTGTAVQYTDTACSVVAGNYPFSFTLTANDNAEVFGIPTANPALPRMKITSLTVNGSIVINLSPKTITVGLNTYVIEGFNVCTIT